MWIGAMSTQSPMVESTGFNLCYGWQHERYLLQTPNKKNKNKKKTISDTKKKQTDIDLQQKHDAIKCLDSRIPASISQSLILAKHKFKTRKNLTWGYSRLWKQCSGLSTWNTENILLACWQ